jgi:hypothetical protein
METPAVQQSQSTPAAVAKTERILRFVDHSTTQLLFSIVGSVVGALMDFRYFCLCGLWVSYSLNRSKALEGIRQKWVIPIHASAVLVAGAALYFVGGQMNKLRPDVYTPKQIANAVWSGHWPPPARQASVIYRDSQKQFAKIDLGFGSDAKSGLSDTFSTEEPPVIIGLARHAGGLTNLPIPSRAVHFSLTAKSVGPVSAKQAHLWVTICDACDWISVPSGFNRVATGPGSLTQVDKAVGDIPAGAFLPLGDFAVALPVQEKKIRIAVNYTCDTCRPASNATRKWLEIALLPKRQ